MDPEDLRTVLRTTGVDLWTLIETAISVAAAEHGRELRARRDGIVERLYVPVENRCRNCEEEMAAGKIKERVGEKRESYPSGNRRRPPSPMAAPSAPREEEGEHEEEEEEVEEEEEGAYHAIDDEQSKILAIKDFLDDPDQSEDSLASLLQNLADMDITFKALKETDIGRHVNGLRKHPSSEVRRLVKLLVRKWKETVDEWVKSNSANDTSSPAIITDGDSPQQVQARNNQNGHQGQEFTSSPNPQARNGGWQQERNGYEYADLKPKPIPRRETQSKPINSTPPSASITKAKEKDSLMDADRLASARKRLQENYQEAQNARKQRTIQVMDIHEIPKPKNAFMAPRGKGGFHAKQW